MKVFISQPMKDKTDKQIKEERQKAINLIKAKYNEDVEIIDSFFENAPHDAKPLWFLGKSLELLADADVAYFCKDWEKYRGCRIENICAKEYGIEVVESDALDETINLLSYNGWIPCSERLPEEETDYLCCYEYTIIGGTHEGEKFKDYGVFYYDGYKWIKYWETINKKNIQVVAWQPLPEPYEEEQ